MTRSSSRGTTWTVDIALVDDGRAAPSLGVSITEPPGPGRFDVEAAKRLGLKPGPDFARLQQGISVGGVDPSEVIGPSRPGRKLCILGPCRPTPAAEAKAADAHLLIAVAPFIEERHEVAVETHTMTGAEAAVLARRAGVNTLALVHTGGGVSPGYARKEAAQFHSRTVVVNDGDRLTVTPAERTVKHIRK